MRGEPFFSERCREQTERNRESSATPAVEEALAELLAAERARRGADND